MNKDLLLDAIGGIDERYIADAQKLRSGDALPVHRRFSPKTMLLIAAVLVSLLALTAYAAQSERICNWALDYLSGTDSMLEATYARTAEEIYQNVNQTVEMNGCTITLQAAISDGKQSYLSFHVVLPEGMQSDLGHYFFEAGPFESNYPDQADDKPIATSYGWRTIPDDHPEDNELDMILTSFSTGDSPMIPHSGYTWNVKLLSLCTYGDPTAETWSRPILAEGPWEFSFTFSTQYQQEPKELIREPVSIWASKQILFHRLVITYPVRAAIESFQVRPMTATCSIRAFGLLSAGDFTMRPIYLVMKNGDVILANQKSGQNNSSTLDFCFSFEVPIDEANIDYVLFPGGVRVPVE